MRFIVFIWTIFIPFLVFAQEGNRLSKISVNDITILKISAKDERAVMKTPDNNLKLLKVGDPLGDRLTIIEIAAGRVVLEEAKEQGTETIIIRLENGEQRIERMTQVKKKRLRMQTSPNTEHTKDSSQARKKQRAEQPE